MPTIRSTLAAVTAVLLVASVLPAGTAVATHDTSDACSFPVTATDATGTDVTLSAEPQRIVVVGPSAVQTAWEVGAREKVVGIDSYSTYLNGTDDLPTIASYSGGVDTEAVLDLDPDLVVIAGDSYEDSISTFRGANVSAYQMPDAESLTDVVNKTRTAGHLFGTCDAAGETATWMEERIGVVRDTVSDENAPSLFYDLGAVSDAPAHYSTGANSFISHLISTAGATNIVENGNFSAYPQVSNEFILEQDPEWLLVTYTPGSSFGASTPADARAAVQNSSVLSRTTAAEEGQIVVVNANNLNQPAPRVIYPLQQLAQEIHPEAYSAANETSQPTATVTATETTAETQTTTPTATDGGSSGGAPGFGAGAALVALAGAALFASRRYQ